MSHASASLGRAYFGLQLHRIGHGFVRRAQRRIRMTAWGL